MAIIKHNKKKEEQREREWREGEGGWRESGGGGWGEGGEGGVRVNPIPRRIPEQVFFFFFFFFFFFCFVLFVCLFVC